MSRIVLAQQVRTDFDRIFNFLFAFAPDSAATRIEAIIAAIDILQTSPLIGRPLAFGQRELVIASGSSGYRALYRYDPALDTAFVLAVRSQREREDKRQRENQTERRCSVKFFITHERLVQPQRTHLHSRHQSR